MAYLGVLRRRFPVLLVCLVAALAGGAYQVHRTPKMYAATATYFVSLPSSGTGSDTTIQRNAVDVTQSFLLSFQQLASKRSTAEAVAGLLGTHVGEVDGHLLSSVETGTFYIDVTATSAVPERARVLADAGAQEVTTLVPQIQGSSRNPASAAITDRAQLPVSPFAPTPTKTLTLAAVLGLVLGLALVALLEALDRTVRSAEMAVRLAGSPLLASVQRRRGADDVEGLLPPGLLEPYRVLRSAVTFIDPDHPPVTLLVTSAAPGEGKTTTVLNLAQALVESGRRVLVVDADLRRMHLSLLSGGMARAGLTAVITRSATLADVVFALDGIDVLPAGVQPPNPAVLLGSGSMREVLAQAGSRYDIVLIDAPPLLAVSDALSLAPMTDATLLVVRWAVTPRTGLAEAGRRLAAAGVVPAGFVLNGVPRAQTPDYYGDYAQLAQ